MSLKRRRTGNRQPDKISILTGSPTRPNSRHPVAHASACRGDIHVDIFTGDSLSVLRKLQTASVHCVVTSPPYWGLRDYGTAKWTGGNPACDHKPKPLSSKGVSLQGGMPASPREKPALLCRKCGARRIDKQIGLEATPEEYVAHLVEIFREVRRVLRDDGTLWLNLGDSYATGAGKVGDCPGGGAQGERWAGRGLNTKDPKWANSLGPISQPNRMPIPGLKPKDLVGIPWRVAFALQADGWYLRSDIIWHKPNPMPESVTDRPTKSHEYLFLLAKSERYYYDAPAVAEPTKADTEARYERARSDSHKWTDGGPGGQTIARSLAHMRSGNRVRRIADGKTRSRLNSHLGSGVPWEDAGNGRNRRTVWTIATAAFKGAHFATFPPKLVEPCILAGSPVGGIVLDPFAGACTTLLVAQQLGRSAIGIELNPAYVALARTRLAADVQTPRVRAGIRKAVA